MIKLNFICLFIWSSFGTIKNDVEPINTLSTDNAQQRTKFTYYKKNTRSVAASMDNIPADKYERITRQEFLKKYLHMIGYVMITNLILFIILIILNILIPIILPIIVCFNLLFFLITSLMIRKLSMYIFLFSSFVIMFVGLVSYLAFDSGSKALSVTSHFLSILQIYILNNVYSSTKKELEEISNNNFQSVDVNQVYK